MQKLVVVFIMLISLVSAQGYWELIGFENENVKCIAQHPQNTSIMLISIADSIYRSSDGGHSWSFVTHFWGLPVNYLTFNPNDGDTVFALLGNGTYSDGIYRSTDAGYTWNVLWYFLSPLCMCIPGDTFDLMLVGCDGDGIFKSEDGGNSWEPWNNGLTDLHIHSLDYCSPFDTFPYFFAGTAQGLFYRHHNGWSQASGIAVNVRVSSISYHKTDEFGFAIVTGGSWSDGIYKSTDFGQNWQVGDYWLYASCVLMNPQWENPGDTLSVFAGDSGLGVKHSTNCGTTWIETNIGLENQYVNSLSCHPGDTLRLFCATQGGLYRYIYQPGINEESNSAPGNIIEIPSNILRADAPIFVKCDNLKENFELRIIDAVGRRVRTDKIIRNTALLKPLKKSGIYFIVISQKGYHYKKKIIVID